MGKASQHRKHNLRECKGEAPCHNVRRKTQAVLPCHQRVHSDMDPRGTAHLLLARERRLVPVALMLPLDLLRARQPRVRLRPRRPLRQ